MTVAAGEETPAVAWRGLACAAADAAVDRIRRLSDPTPHHHCPLVGDVFDAFRTAYLTAMAGAAAAADSDAFPAEWAAFQRDLAFESRYVTILEALAEIDAESVVRHALQMRFTLQQPSGDPFVTEALADLSERVAARTVARALHTTEHLSRATVEGVLARGMAAPRTCAAYADDWARTIGIASRHHFDLVLQAFRTELAQFELKSSLAPEAAGLFSMLTYVRVVLAPPAPDSANAGRLRRLLDLHRSIFLSRQYKHPLPAVVLAQLTVLDLGLRQWWAPGPAASADLIDLLYRKADALSRLPACKPAALALMASLLERGPRELHGRAFDAFVQKRVLRHVGNPRKMAHCLHILLRILRGKYQARVHLNNVEGDAVADSVAVHPLGDSPTFHPYACRMRTTGSSTDCAADLFRLAKPVVLSRKVVHVSWPRYQSELVEIVMQFAVHDVIWTVDHILMPLLVWRKSGNQPELLLALEAAHRIFDEHGAFHRHALSPELRTALRDAPLTALAATIESILGRALFDLPADRAQVPLHVTTAAAVSAAADLCAGDNFVTLGETFPDDSDLDDSHDAPDYSMSPHTRRTTSRTTSTYTLRLGSNEFPFLETLPQSLLGPTESATAPASDDSCTSHTRRPSRDDFRLESDPDRSRLRAAPGSLAVPQAAIRCLGTMPSARTATDPQSAVFLVPVVLAPDAALAGAASYALQQIAGGASGWFTAVTDAVLRYMAGSVALHEWASLATLLRHLGATLEFCMTRNAVTESATALQALDATALVYLAHESAVVRGAALHLSHCVRQCYARSAMSATWSLSSWLSERGAALVLSAHVCLAEHAKAQSPGGLAHRDAPGSAAFSSRGPADPPVPSYSPPHAAVADPVRLGFRDLMLDDDRDAIDRVAAGLIVALKCLGEVEEAAGVLDQARGAMNQRLLATLGAGVASVVSGAASVRLLVAALLAQRPRSELAANDLFLNLWNFVLVENRDSAFQKSVELALAFAHVDHLSLLVTTLNQARNATHSRVASQPVKKSGKRNAAAEFERHDRAAIDSLWSQCLVALSEPKRLRIAFLSSVRARSLYLELCRYGITKSFRKWAKTPEHLADRAQFLSNVCFALRRRHKYEGVDFSGPFLEAEIPEWTQDDRSRTLCELHIWSECGDVASPLSEELFSLLRSRWTLSLDRRVHQAVTTHGKPLTERERAALSLELQSRMSDQFPVALAGLRLSAFWCASRILSLGPALDEAAIAEGGWLDWALQAEAQSVPVLQMLVCFHWREMAKLLDRLYWETSEAGPLAQNLFVACASQLVPVCFGLSAYMTRHELEDSVPLSDDDIVLQNLKRPLIHDMLAPLLVCAIFHMGAPSRRVSQTAAAMLARLCDTLVTKSLSRDQAKSLAVLRTHHPGLQSQVAAIRCKNALIIARTMASLCSADLTASILAEVVLRWAQFHNAQWQQKQWFLNAFEAFFLALPYHRYSVTDSAGHMLSDMVNVTRSLVRDASPALPAMLSVWQAFAGTRTDPARNDNVIAVADFLLDGGGDAASGQEDYIGAAALIAVELYRHSPLSVLDCILQRFDQLGVSPRALSDPVCALRAPATLLSSVLGARFQTGRPRLPAVLHHTFLWLGAPRSPCARILQDLLHYSNVLRGAVSVLPSPVAAATESVAQMPSLGGLIQPIPSLEKVLFQWMGDDCLDWDVTDDARILAVFERIARCTSAISDAEFVVPLEFICRVVKRWVGRAFGEAVVDDWAALTFHTATQTPHPALRQVALRVVALLGLPDSLDSYLSLGLVLAATDTVTDMALILHIYSLSFTLPGSWTYDQFRIISSIYYQSVLIVRDAPNATLLCTALALLQSCLRHGLFCVALQEAECVTASVARLAEDFLRVGDALGLHGLQPVVIDVIIAYPDSADILTLALSLLVALWAQPRHGLVDCVSGTSRRYVALFAILPWLRYHGANLVLAQQFCARLASAIDESPLQWQFAEIAAILRAFAAGEMDAVDRLTLVLVSAADSATASVLLRVLRRGHASLRAATLTTVTHLLQAGAAPPLFSAVVRYATTLIPASTHGPDLVALAQLVREAATHSATRSGEEDPEAPGTGSCATSLVTLARDPTGFFAASALSTHPIAFPGGVRGDASKARFESRRASFVMSPGSATDSAPSTDIVPVPCTLANLIETPHLADHFRRFVAMHGDVRGLDFYAAVHRDFGRVALLDPNSDAFRVVAATIIDRFVGGADVAAQIDVDGAVKRDIVEQMARQPGPALFHRAVHSVKHDLMASFTAFCDSAEYELLVRSGQLISP